MAFAGPPSCGGGLQPGCVPALADLVLVVGRGLREQRSLVAERQLALLLAMPVHDEPPQVSTPPADLILQTMIMKERVGASRLKGGAFDVAQLGAWSWGSPVYEGLKSLCQQRGRLHRKAVKGMAGPGWGCRRCRMRSGQTSLRRLLLGTCARSGWAHRGLAAAFGRP